MKFRKSILFLSLISIVFLSPSAFALQWGDFTYTVSGGTVTITGYSGCPNAGAVVIPAAINGMPVIAIGESAFEGCLSLTSVTIPDSVTSIGAYTFWRCTGLTSVTIPNSLTSIGYYAFLGCSTLTSVTIPNSVTSIGGGAFAGCSGLNNIVVDASNTVYSSQDGVLYNKAMTVLIQYPGGKSGGFTIPDSITSIGGYAFDGCSGLTSVTIPDSVKSIEDYTFWRCTGLTSVTISDSVTSIGSHAFDSCTGLTSVTIPSSVTIIWDWAFYGCAVLTRAYFLGNAPTMGTGLGGVFDGCASNFTVCYTFGSNGFKSPTWNGYPARVCRDNQCAAEAIYGENAEQTELLRKYRDDVLSKTPDGQEFIKNYYKFSPAVTKLLEQRPLLKNRAKAFIDSMLSVIRKKVEESN